MEGKGEIIKTDNTRRFLDVIEEAARKRKVYPERVVERFRTIPRAHFVPPSLSHFLPLVENDDGCGGVLSQPFVIFVMVASLGLKGDEVVLEGGTGVGYQTAILAGLCKHVYSIEYHPKRVAFAKERLEALGITNVTIVEGDAAYGLPQYAPFDRAIFGCAIHGEVDAHLMDQMAPDSRITIPTGTYNEEGWMAVGDLLYADKYKGEVVQRISRVFGGTLSFMPLLSNRPIGWTVKDGVCVPSDQVVHPVSLAKKITRWFSRKSA